MKGRLSSLAGAAGLFAVTALATAVISLSGIAHGAGGSTNPPNLVPAPTPQVHSVMSSQVLHYVPGSYISGAQAEAIALLQADQVGSSTVLGAKLENIAAAERDAGEEVATLNVGGDVMVWLVWLQGPYDAGCITADSCSGVQNRVFWMSIDAKSGRIYAGGFNVHAPGMPVPGSGAGTPAQGS